MDATIRDAPSPRAEAGMSVTGPWEVIAATMADVISTTSAAKWTVSRPTRTDTVTNGRFASV